jgi:hypothetical protein
MAHQRCRAPQTHAIFAYLRVAHGLFPKKKPQRLLRPLKSHTRASAKRLGIILTVRMVVGTLPYRLLAHSEQMLLPRRSKLKNGFEMCPDSNRWLIAIRRRPGSN